MNQSSHAVREQHINLLRLNERGYFALTEGRMHHGLSAAIGARLIIRRAYFRRARTGGAAVVGDARAADRATDARNSALLTDRGHDMPALFAALDAHLLDAISGREDRFLYSFHFYCFHFHNSPPGYFWGSLCSC